MMELSIFGPVFSTAVFAANCWAVVGAPPWKTTLVTLREDERHERADQAEGATAGDAHDETPAIGLYVAIKPAVGTPADADRLPERGLGWCGLRFTHSAGAAGADSSDSIASITDCVEIWFIGTARCLGSNSLTGPLEFTQENDGRFGAGMPVKGIGRAKQDHLRSVPGGREVHRRGIDRNEQAGLANKRREREQIGLPGKVDYAPNGSKT